MLSRSCTLTNRVPHNPGLIVPLHGEILLSSGVSPSEPEEFPAFRVHRQDLPDTDAEFPLTRTPALEKI
jgi:hypothetical protein